MLYYLFLWINKLAVGWQNGSPNNRRESEYKKHQNANR
jgi:hypothetical protein